MEIVERMFLIMKEKNIKSSELADHLGISPSVVSSWKTRKTNPPSEYLLRICEITGVSPYFLLGGKENNQNNLELTEEEINLVNSYKRLSEKNKGKVEGYIDSIMGSQSDNKSKTKKREYISV